MLNGLKIDVGKFSHFLHSNARKRSLLQKPPFLVIKLLEFTFKQFGTQLEHYYCCHYNDPVPSPPPPVVQGGVRRLPEQVWERPAGRPGVRQLQLLRQVDRLQYGRVAKPPHVRRHGAQVKGRVNVAPQQMTPNNDNRRKRQFLTWPPLAGYLVEERRRWPDIYGFPTRTIFQINSGGMFRCENRTSCLVGLKTRPTIVPRGSNSQPPTSIASS